MIRESKNDQHHEVREYSEVKSTDFNLFNLPPLQLSRVLRYTTTFLSYGTYDHLSSKIALYSDTLILIHMHIYRYKLSVICTASVYNVGPQAIVF